jgi:hypothetical protein
LRRQGYGPLGERLVCPEHAGARRRRAILVLVSGGAYPWAQFKVPKWNLCASIGAIRLKSISWGANDADAG